MKVQKLENILAYVLKNKYSAFFYTPPIYKNSVSYIFKKPRKTVSVNTISGINKVLKILDTKNLLAYSLIDYEAGYVFEKSLNKYFVKKNGSILINIFNKNNYKKIKSKFIDIGDFDIQQFKIENYKLNTNKTEYTKNISKIKKYLRQGDTYQVNYTLKSSFNFSGDYITLFKTLIFNQSAKYSAIINLGDKILVSISPELFFEIKNDVITTIPMKGTIKRGKNIDKDIKNNLLLKTSIKDKAENVMIVDLLRNDIGKFCKYGSVKANDLFSIEKYESLFQMVSKVTGKLNKSTKVSDVIKNIFPCGSVTGAPKIRTMELINELEKEKRGIYTGSIGIIENNKAIFNVAIRTMEIDKRSGKGIMGLGSGIVIDSNSEQEFKEVKLKGQFLKNPNNYFELFETMLIQKGIIKDWNAHVKRIKYSADYFLFNPKYKNFDLIRNKILKSVDKNKSYRLKILLKKSGELDYKISEYSKPKNKIKIVISKKKIMSSNSFQYFKTTNRKLYEDELNKFRKKDFFDVIFFNEKGELAEGSITNIFVKIDNEWITPKISCGILNGIERNKLLRKDKKVKESIIKRESLLKAENIMLTNSLIGRLNVNELHLDNGKIFYY